MLGIVDQRALTETKPRDDRLPDQPRHERLPGSCCPNHRQLTGGEAGREPVIQQLKTVITGIERGSPVILPTSTPVMLPGDFGMTTKQPDQSDYQCQATQLPHRRHPDLLDKPTVIFQQGASVINNHIMIFSAVYD